MSTAQPSIFTFLFTDIEGSTRLWEQYPQTMGAALARHDKIVRHALSAQGGEIFNTAGDAYCVAFTTSKAALNAALAIQQGLLAEDWGEVEAIRVRIGLHSGEAEVRDGDYFGPTLNRTARLMAAGHGGQVLLSDVTAQMLGAQLPDGCSLRDMGERRLRNLRSPEHIYQLVAPGLPDSFPPLRTLELPANNLPVQPTPFLGRKAEIAQLKEMLRQHNVRLITLTGPGGMGKTRLSLQVAAEMLDEFADGVYFVALAPISDPELVLPTIAQTLGLKEATGQNILTTLQQALSDKQMLLVLDNFEQVTAASSKLAELMTGAAQLKLLVSSRNVLHIYGEHEYLLPPLTLPDPKRLPPLEEWGQYTALALFVGRVQAVRPDFTLTPANAQAVVDICQRLDGIPLAIELAAAQGKMFSPAQMVARLGKRLKLLTSTMPNLPDRQRSLRGAIDWSYSLLTDSEQLLFARLAVFVGGCTLDAVEEVCNADQALGFDCLDLVAALADKSLVRQTDMVNEPRFVMLETIREYALEKLGGNIESSRISIEQKSLREFASGQLADSGEEDEMRTLHARYYLTLSETAGANMDNAAQAGWLNRLEAEHDNIRAALTWALTHDAPLALRIAASIWRFWQARGYLSEGQRWLTEALSNTAAEPGDMVRARALDGAGWLSSYLGNQHEAAQLLEQAVVLFRQTSDKRGLSEALIHWANARSQSGDLVGGSEVLAESLTVARQLGDQWRIASALEGLGIIAHMQADYDSSRRYYEESLALRRKAGNERGIAISAGNVGDAAYMQNDFPAARQFLREAIMLGSKVNDQLPIMMGLIGLAGVEAAEHGKAQAVRATRLFAAGDNIINTIKFSLEPADMVQYERALADCRALLSVAEFAAAWAEGYAMNLEQAVAYALRDDE